jgi:lipid A 3-O-deacylase
LPAASTKYFEPVTVPAAPRKVIFGMARYSSGVGPLRGVLFRRLCALASLTALRACLTLSAPARRPVEDRGRRGNMKRIASVLFLILFTAVLGSAAEAQDAATATATPSQAPAPQSTSATVQDATAREATTGDLPTRSLTKGTWELGVIAGGGEGLGIRSNTQFFYAGGRVGAILTHEHFSGWIRGNFEWAVDLMPIYVVFPPQSAIYGGSFKPVMWLWNFTSGKKIAPYFGPAAGVLFSTHNVPPGDTSYVNFTPQAVFGTHVFLKKGRALVLETAIVHHSSASLGTQNPGYNASIFFTIGYSWFKVRER